MSPSNNKVAVVHDYDSLWSYNHQPHNQDVNYWYQFILFYSALRKLGLTVDIVKSKQLMLRDYALVVCLALTLLIPESAKYIIKASETTNMIFGPRKDFRDQYGKATEKGQFQQLGSFIHGELINFESLRPTLLQGITPSDRYSNDTQHEAKLWCESYNPLGSKVLYSYQGGPLDGQAAVIESVKVVTIGALSETLIESVVQQKWKEVGGSVRNVPLEDGVRITQVNNKRLFVNFNQQAMRVDGHELSPVSYRIV